MRKLYLFLLVGLFLLSFASAYTKSYDAQNKILTIKSNGGTDLVKLQLLDNTYECLWECYAILKVDVLVDGLSSPVSAINIKKKVGQVWMNGQLESLKVQSWVGSLQNGEWVDRNLAQINTGLANSGTYYVRLLGTKKHYLDELDWIPNFFNELDGDEWAVWGSSLNTGIIAYYTFDNGTQLEDFYSNYDLASNNGATNRTGKIGSAWDFQRTDSDYITFDSTFPNLTSSFTINMWIKPDDCTSAQKILSRRATIKIATNTISLDDYGGITTTCQLDTWHMITLVHNSAEVSCLFQNPSSSIPPS